MAEITLEGPKPPLAQAPVFLHLQSIITLCRLWDKSGGGGGGSGGVNKTEET